MFKAKVRNVGTSLGLLIPKEIAEEDGIKAGDTIEVGLLKKDLRLLEKYFGIDKGAKKFVRDHIDRLDRYKNAA